ncbi:carbohydrate-binding module family 50 protein [Trichocladium antarcticum]|uniref:Carbohydrate-binding module family 50 protein n=1 Tax=Trichocladium antarcticum TaxID=1450529 RepID=A0AAN6UGM5_9PEZI|nr:carbohydrate-binding module family 50 protein [Trichocladium antarcticum]
MLPTTLLSSLTVLGLAAVTAGIPTATSSQKPVLTVIPIEDPNMPGAAARCRKFVSIEKGATCISICNENKITLDKIRAWNPLINEDCTNLWIGYRVCVGVFFQDLMWPFTG